MDSRPSRQSIKSLIHRKNGSALDIIHHRRYTHFSGGFHTIPSRALIPKCIVQRIGRTAALQTAGRLRNFSPGC